jgi:flagellar protein FliO/FliZ
MFASEIARMVFSLAIVLGLIGILVVLVRRYGPESLRQLQTGRADRRLTVIESLVLDPSRRLVLVRFDQEEQLILLGEGQLLSNRTASAVRKGE